MKRKNLDKKKRAAVREKDWERHGDTAFSHDLARHRRAMARLSETAISAGQDALPADFTPNAVVIAHAKKWVFVQLTGEVPGQPRERICLIDERLHEGEDSLIAPGDRVYVEFEEEDAFVRGVAPRTSALGRPAGVHDRLKRQVLAANVDQLVIVAALVHPRFRPGLVDRYLITAETGGVQPLLVLNKADLAEGEVEELAIYLDLGVTVVRTSCVTGEGIETLRALLEGKTSVFSGHSGVGKTSLLNALDPELELHTLDLSRVTEKGRHATTLARLFMIAGGIRVIDTPGIRHLGLWDVTPAEVAYYFPELAAAAPDCKYRNCTHIHEPDCAVLRAVDEGRIPAPRYASYARIRASLESETGTTPGRVRPTGEPWRLL